MLMLEGGDLGSYLRGVSFHNTGCPSFSSVPFSSPGTEHLTGEVSN